ncbi:acyltransferase family protein [Maritalea sp.]|uniref:acyltransferase family protein n=1 Tax=Maritalea sp. TaxID=2003361 RepID=UPI003EF70A34
MSQSQRLDWVDAAKGISILLVVMLYATNSAGEATNNIGALHYVIGFATPFRMPEFFLISGLFLASVIARPWAKFADRRAVHYLYFYVLWAIIHIVLKVGIASRDPGMALEALGWAVIQPYGVLWFIYVLALTSLATKVLMELRIPHWLAFAGAAALNLAQLDTQSYALDQFARYYVFFYAGYAFAPFIFNVVDKAMNAPKAALAILAIWALANGALVFTPGFVAEPGHFTMGLAEIPVIKIVLALIGTLALCVGAGLLTKVKWMGWLSYIGKRSLVIYVAFVLPMGIARTILVKFNLVTDTTLLSIVTMLIALITPLIAYWVVQKINFGHFLFTRPAWASLPQSRSKPDQPIKYGSPAE